MPKQVNLSPNLRIDITDLTQQTVGLSVDGQKHLAERTILDNKPVVLDGFRVQVTDAATKWITVYNGVAFDRDGQIINNEDDFAAKRDITFTSNNTYYVEVIYTQTASDSDSRGFWDPTYSNGSDPSGDARPKGREVNDNVSTRITPDWQIVSPISTSGFELDTNPNSLKIPVAKVIVAGGVITGTTHSISSVLLQAVTPSSSKIYVTNSRELPVDSFSLVLSPGTGLAETVTISTNDQENGILTLGSSPGNTHPIGSRCSVTGSVFLTTQGTGSLDQRTHFFSGDENTGYLLGLDPNDVGDTRTDTELKSLKNYIDHLSSQIRELKFGASQNTTLGNTAPPLGPFTTNNRYYSPSSGVIPSRSVSVSIGDGVNTFGDFNTNAVSVNTAFTNAVAYLNTRGGGTLYIKDGTYSLTTGLTATVPIHIVGESRNRTIVNPAHSSATLTRTTSLTIENIMWAPVSYSTLTACFIGTGKINAYNCDLGGIGGNLNTSSTFSQVVIGSTTQPINVTALIDCVFDNVKFTQSTGVSASDCIVKAGVASNVSLRNCIFGSTSTGTAIDHAVYINSTDATGGAQSISIEDCTFIYPFSGGVPFVNALLMPKADTCRIQNNIVYLGGTSTGIYLYNEPTNCDVLGNTIICKAGASSTTAQGIILDGSTACTVANNTITDCVNSIYGTSSSYISKTNITNNSIGATTTLGVNLTGILIESTCTKTEISSNNINSLKTSAANSKGISLISAPSVTDTIISNNQLDTVWGTTNACGIELQEVERVSISNNLITNINPTSSGVDSTCYGIYADTCNELSVSNNQIDHLGTSGLGTTNSTCSGIFLTGELINITENNNQIHTIGNTSATATGISSLLLNLDTNSTSITISNNQIKGITSPYGVVVHGIGLLTAASLVDMITIKNNSIDSNNPYCNAVSIINTVGSISNCSILGNLINTGKTGVNVLATDELSSTLINDNNISLSYTSAVAVTVTGVTIALTPQVTVKGNFIDAPHQGINVAGISNFITGNSILISGNAASNAGIIVNKKWFNINGNTVIYKGYTNSDACCIDASQVPSSSGPEYVVGSIIGNVCYWGADASTNRVYAHGIRVPTTWGSSHSIIYANVCSVVSGATWTSGDGFAIERNGTFLADSGTQATTDTEGGNPFAAPTGYSDIGLNFRAHIHI
jgi:hypothetical protein